MRNLASTLSQSRPAAKYASLLLVFFLVGCQPADTSSQLKPVMDTYAEAWNTGNLDLLDDIIDPGFVRILAGDTVAVGLDSLKSAISSVRTAYPDFNVTVEEEIFNGSKAAGTWVFTATNTGPGDFPPTGKMVRVTGVSIIHFANGKIAREIAEAANLSLMLQLGFTLTPPAPAQGE